MKKLIFLFVLAAYLSACSSYKGSSQTWLPNQHKKVDYTKPPKRPR